MLDDEFAKPCPSAEPRELEFLSSHLAKKFYVLRDLESNQD